MPRWKFISFSKRSILETEKVIHFKLYHQKDRRSKYDLKQTKFRKQSLSGGFYTPEHQNRKIQFFTRSEKFFSFQTPLKFLELIDGLWRKFSWQKRPLYSLKKTSNGGTQFVLYYIISLITDYYEAMLPPFLCFL